METSNKQMNETAVQPGVVDYAAALRQYNLGKDSFLDHF